MLRSGRLPADMAELVDAPDLGSGFARSEGSSPFIRILNIYPVDRQVLTDDLLFFGD
jgi:hypothetical protein